MAEVARIEALQNAWLEGDTDYEANLQVYIAENMARSENFQTFLSSIYKTPWLDKVEKTSYIVTRVIANLLTAKAFGKLVCNLKLSKASLNNNVYLAEFEECLEPLLALTHTTELTQPSSQITNVILNTKTVETGLSVVNSTVATTNGEIAKVLTGAISAVQSIQLTMQASKAMGYLTANIALHSNPAIAPAWNRLVNGTFTAIDLNLLELEYAESKFADALKPMLAEARATVDIRNVTATPLTRLPAPQGIIREFVISKQTSDHLINPKHQLDLIFPGKSASEILDVFKEKIYFADLQKKLIVGDNQIITTINDMTITIRVHIQNGSVRSCNGFKGISDRICQNTIHL